MKDQLEEVIKSKYNIIVDRNEKGEVLIFNSFTGYFTTLNKQYMKYFNEFESNVNKNLEIESDLLKAGIIINNGITEQDMMEITKGYAKYSTSNLELTIAPTSACNMKCSYCYEEKDGAIMDDHTEDEILSFIEKYHSRNGLKALTIL